MSASVIIVTLNRPDCLQRCLECVTTQEPSPNQVIVVDSSIDERTAEVAKPFAGVEYIRHAHGAGKMTRSRNLGLARATSDIIVFIDDDAYAHPGWLREVTSSFEVGVGAVGGRALRDQSGECREGVEEIGQLTRAGQLTGFFAADPGRPVEVDHVIGCNMAFPRDVLARLGGLREDYKGTSGVREDTDVCLRVKQLGYRVVFNPRAVVDHAGAPQVTGVRFDLRYDYYAQRNHCLLLVRNFGLTKPIMWRYLSLSAFEILHAFGDRLRDRRPAVASARLAVHLAGMAAGTAHGIVVLLRSGRDPVRRGKDGRAMTIRLEGHGDLSRPE